MYVNHAEPRLIQEPLGKELSVSSDYAEVGAQRTKLGLERVPGQSCRLEHGQLLLQSKRLDGGFRNPLPASTRPVWLRYDAHDLMAGAQEGGQHRHREGRSPEERDAEAMVRHDYHWPARASFLIFRTMRSRLIPRNRSTKSRPSRWSISC